MGVDPAATFLFSCSNMLTSCLWKILALSLASTIGCIFTPFVLNQHFFQSEPNTLPESTLTSPLLLQTSPPSLQYAAEKKLSHNESASLSGLIVIGSVHSATSTMQAQLCKLEGTPFFELINSEHIISDCLEHLHFQYI